MKSYGRASTFLMLTGYEQVRSVVWAIVGDLAGARSVELMLPETGVCSTDRQQGGGGCCGAPSAELAFVEAGDAIPLMPAAPVAVGSGRCG